MKIRKLLALVLSLAMVLPLLAGSAALADDVQVIRMWSNDQHDQAIIRQKIDEFNATIGKENGIAVEYTVYGSDYYTTLDVAVSAGEGPDIFKCNKIGNYSEAGYVLPWDEIPGLADLIARHAPFNAPGYGEFGGHTYACPFRVTTYGVACNKDLFDQYDVEIPTTWDEMEAAAKAITDASGGSAYGYALAMGYGSYHYFYVTLANGASVGDEYFNHTSGRYDFESLSGFLRHVLTFVEDGSMFPGYETMTGDVARAQFSAGTVAMIGAMSSDVTTFKNQFPCDFEWVMIPYPVADAEHSYKEPVGVSMSYVIGAAAADYTDKVALFLNYLYSDEVYIATSEAQVDIAIFNEILEQCDTTAMDPNWLSFANMDTFCIKYPNPDSYLTIEGDTYQDVIGKILTGVEKDIDGALAALTVKYNTALDAAIAAGKIDINDFIDPDIAAKMQAAK